MLRRGDLVEFTKAHHIIYPPDKESDILFGVAIEDTDLNAGNGSCKVEIASGEIVTANYIYAYGWTGWVPDGLEEVYHKHNLNEEDFD